jgi:hypothetical protein
MEFQNAILLNLKPDSVIFLIFESQARKFNGRPLALPRLSDLVQQHEGETFVTSLTPESTGSFLSEALGLPLDYLFRLDQNYGCLNVIDYFGHGRGSPVKRRSKRHICKI